MERRKAGRLRKIEGITITWRRRKPGLVFREVWDRCRAHEGYQELKNILREQKKWKKMERQESEQFKVEEIKMEQDSKI